jgi:antitoxin component of MazEF toxin-antitoxin module
MPIELYVEVVGVGNSLQVAVPKEILKSVRIQKGNVLLMGRPRTAKS